MHLEYRYWSPKMKRRYLREERRYWTARAITESIKSIDVNDDVWRKP